MPQGLGQESALILGGAAPQTGPATQGDTAGGSTPSAPATGQPAGGSDVKPPDFNLNPGDLPGGPQTPEEAMIAEATSLYEKLWGLVPSATYIKRLVDQGMNLYEIEAYERAKPAFNQTFSWRDRAVSLMQKLGDIFGTGRA